MSKILFNGYYGYLNTGDSSFMEVSAWGAKRIWKQKEVFFQTPHSGSLPKLDTKATFYKDWHIKGNYSLQQVYHLHTSKYFISAGGSIFQKQLQPDDIKLKILRSRIKRKITIGAIGVSIGPFKSVAEENAIKAYLSKIDFLAVRDKRSFEITRSFNLPYTTINAGDLSALLPQVYLMEQNKNQPVKSENKVIAVSYCNYESYNNLDKSKERFRCIKLTFILNELLLNPNNQLNFLIFNGHPVYGDYKPTLELVALLKPIHDNQIKFTHFNHQVKYFWNKIQQCDLLISTRLHAAEFACFGAIPFFLVEYHQKCSDFLDDIGHNPSYRIHDLDSNHAQTLNNIEQILYKNNYIIPEKLDEVKSKSILNFEATKEHFNES